MTTSEHLVAALEAAQALPASWRDAFLAVLREQFIPAQIWVSDGKGDVALGYHSHNSWVLTLDEDSVNALHTILGA